MQGVLLVREKRVCGPFRASLLFPRARCHVLGAMAAAGFLISQQTTDRQTDRRILSSFHHVGRGSLSPLVQPLQLCPSCVSSSASVCIVWCGVMLDPLSLSFVFSLSLLSLILFLSLLFLIIRRLYQPLQFRSFPLLLLTCIGLLLSTLWVGSYLLLDALNDLDVENPLCVEWQVLRHLQHPSPSCSACLSCPLISSCLAVLLGL